MCEEPRALFYPFEEAEGSEGSGVGTAGAVARGARHGARRPALLRQEGGSHYKGMKIQPVEYIFANGIGYLEGCVIKYVSRWRAKNGLEDLRKARHVLDLLIELEGDKNANQKTRPL